MGKPLLDAIADARAAIGTDEYEAAAARGGRMSDDELVSYLSEVASQLGDARP
jgi:hypothetical protein